MKPPQTWNDRADIPNQDGYTLTVLLDDGTTAPARVFKGGDGCHRLKHRNGDRIAIETVRGWKAALAALLALAASATAAPPTPIEVVAAVIVAEAGGEGVAGMRAVREVIQMRAYERRQTEHAVAVAPKQFSCLNRTTPARLVVAARQCSTWNTALALASRPVAQATVWQANHYHSTAVRPAWAAGQRPVAIVGNHVFYRLTK
jgi:hypothetical protein